MSDSTIVTGRIVFQPPLVWAQYRDTHAATEKHSVLVVEETVETVDTEDGQLTRRTAVALVPRRPGERWGARGLEAELEQWAQLADRSGAVMTGRIYTEYEPMSITRWWVDHHADGRDPNTGIHRPLTVRQQTAMVVWPDGTSAYTPVKDPRYPRMFLELGDGPPVFDGPARTDIGEIRETAQAAYEREASAAKLAAITAKARA
jgi:hypothetical protein